MKGERSTIDIEAGKLRHLLRVQEPVAGTPNAFNETPMVPTTIASVYGSIETLGGQELYHAQQIWPLTTHDVVIRWHPSIKQDGRLLFEGRIFEILNVCNVQERNIKMVLACKEVQR